LGIIRRLGIGQANVVHLLVAVGRGLLIDLLLFVAFIAVLLFGGNRINVSLDELFKVSASQHFLEYGYQIVVGNTQLGTSQIGAGIGIHDIDFNELRHRSDPPPIWVHWLFPDPAIQDEDGSLCRQYELGFRECTDRLRSIYFAHFPKPDS
jgi:hypothetical protein